MLKFFKATAAIAAVLGLVACSVLTDENATTFEKVQASYVTAQSQVDIYSSLPICSEEIDTLCSDPAVVEKLQKYLTLVGTQIETAQSQIDAGLDATFAQEQALTTLGTLFAIYAAQALKQ